ncbi:uncharacterized protein MELLADRAFT_90461 [Melampsora larici-populina 98AG31]|uniref:Pre-rRNA-processing protein IPI3 n=1 Tax=Melampsora larici-populina (strain 98AG31 / pathotype 3-4-7) TaxID=747676 RepID=F4RX13_MELLP|nr:uncharacterized protein MELLADRAFT_90461 [Melampsora larici-populina 98AG31]EGG03124.1 hypothetical protein MELLADRAFT_90461 [Melampsora larici-populina 98AG31]
MSQHSPIIFSGIPSCEDGNQNLSFHELSSSIQLLQLKPTPSSSFSISSTTANQLPPRQSIVSLPSINSIGSTIISIAGKDGRNGLMVWTSLNNKPTPTLKLIPPGRVVCICTSLSGIYLAAGSSDGTVLIWELSTGILLASFDAHYKSITCLRFTDDDAALVTASEDSMCSVWSLPALIDEGANANMSYAPYVLLSDHTLPISDIHISHGTFPDIRIFTASLDQTIKIWTPLYPSCPLLSTFAVPGPAHHLAVDPLERFIFVSYPITTQSSENPSTQNPKSGTPATTSLKSSASIYSASTVRVIPLFSKPAHAAHQGGASLVHSSNGFIHQTLLTDSSDPTYTSPQDTSITALHFPSSICSSPMLLCGLSNGKIIHLSIPSLQPLGSTVPRTGSTGTFEPVVHISVFLRPKDLMMNYSGKTTGMSTGMNHNPSSPSLVSARVIGMLGRIIGRNGDMSRVQSKQGQISDQVLLKDRKVMIKFGRKMKYFNDGFEDDEFDLLGFNQVSKSTSLVVGSLNRSECIGIGNGNGSSTGEMVKRLQEESMKLKEQLGQALRLNDVMWNGIVQGTLKLNENENETG